MKNIMFIFCCFWGTVCYAQECSFDIVSRLKRDHFNLSFYELSFCINEIHSILENDTNYFDAWRKRVKQIQFQGQELSYLKKIEYLFFNDMQKNNSDNKYYPQAVKFVQESQLNVEVDKTLNFSQVFSDYIEYPEQVDDACLIMLVCNDHCDYFTEIQNDEIALWNFDNWLQYGFEEFRYSPSLSNKSKNTITDRIINYIFNKKDCADKELVQKSKTMIKATIESYKK